MTTRTYRVSLVGEPEDTSRALAALDRLFGDEALALLRGHLGSEGLTVQRLVADPTEVVLHVTPDAGPMQAATQEVEAEEMAAESGQSGSASMGTERPPP